MMDRKRTAGLCALCWLVYFTSYLTRINYGAVISEIAEAQGFLKSQAGIVTTASFITYGMGQIASGFLGDRLDSRKLIFWGLLATSLMNILLPLCGRISLMTVVWSVNGFAQSLMWPPLVKTMAMYLNPSQFKHTCVNVNIASAVGTISVYFLGPACIEISGWKLTFYVSAAAGILTALLWRSGLKRIGEPFYNDSPQKKRDCSLAGNGVVLTSGLYLLAAAAIPQGVLRDGITTWLPTLLSETFHMKNTAAILATVAIPLFTIISLKCSAILHEKIFKNEAICAGIVFSVGCIGCFLMTVYSQKNAYLSVILSTLITGCMHGVNLILISIAPARFQKYGAVATVSGIVNSLSYAGSAMSSYGFAKLFENFGWNFTLVIWIILSILGTILCFLSAKRWQKFIFESYDGNPSQNSVAVDTISSN